MSSNPHPRETRPAPVPRTYSVQHHRDLHREYPGSYRTTGLDWRLYCYGDGHWCTSAGYAGAFSNELAAHSAGRQWVETGRLS